ncbi:hypothetical protein HYV11_03880 [Candidatus Dependentiae bacterium]|nr:hypothetical protein [Candidatus Dependentiae bacterium]
MIKRIFLLPVVLIMQIQCEQEPSSYNVFSQKMSNIFAITCCERTSAIIGEEEKEKIENTSKQRLTLPEKIYLWKNTEVVVVKDSEYKALVCGASAEKVLKTLKVIKELEYLVYEQYGSMLKKQGGLIIETKKNNTFKKVTCSIKDATLRDIDLGYIVARLLHVDFEGTFSHKKVTIHIEKK